MLTNQLNIPLSVAVFLATDEYFYQSGKTSASSLYKPIKQFVLGKQVPPEQRIRDISQNAKSSYGTAIHNGIEKAWKTNYKEAMQALGYPQHAIDSIRLNPVEEEIPKLMKDPSLLPVFTERRRDLQLKNGLVTGEYDFSVNGRLRDFKATGTYTYTHQTKAKDYMMQGSIYRAIHPDTLTDDFMEIDYMFWDWNAKSVGIGNYPKAPVVAQQIPLMEINETKEWMEERLYTLNGLYGKDESELPPCTPEELWMGPSVFKYYSNPDKTTGRATKNFDNYSEAIEYKNSKGKGTVIEVPGEAKACNYCAAFPICKQKDNLIAQGLLNP